MAALIAQTVAQRISTLLNVSIEAQQLGNSGRLEIRARGLDRPHGFSVECWSGLSFVYATLKLDSLGGALLRALSKAEPTAWERFFLTIEGLAAMGSRIDVKFNDALATSRPTLPISSFGLSAKTIDWQGDVSIAVADLGASVAGVFMSMLPLDNPELDSPQASETWDVEGGRRRVVQNVYERSRSNRALAILAHGTKCIVCGFDFGRAYGPFGEGFVEIHHLTPVHLMNGARIVNPLEELVPLCSNCHSMVHRVDPPMPLVELREIFEVHRD